VALADHLPEAKNVTCAYIKALPMLDPTDAAQLKAAMASDAVTATDIAKALVANKTPYVSRTVLAEHRRGACVCNR